MRRIIGNFISVFFTGFRLLLLKIIHPKGLKCGLIERFSPNVVMEMGRKSRLVLGKRIRIHSGCKLKVRKNASLQIGNGVKMNYNCIIVSKEKIVIGKGTEFGPNVFVYDHDHDYRIGLKENKFISDPVVIGDNCWIGANTIILKGTKIGDNCTIGAGSIISGEIESGVLVVQKREKTLVNIAQ